MNVKHVLIISMALLFAVLGSPSRGQEVDQRHIQIAEIEATSQQVNAALAGLGLVYAPEGMVQPYAWAATWRSSLPMTQRVDDQRELHGRGARRSDVPGG